MIDNKNDEEYTLGDPYPSSASLYEAILPTISKGKHPQYFADRNLDITFTILMATVLELAVTRDRLDTVERMAMDKGLFGPDDVDAYELDTEARLARTRRHEQYFHHVLRTVNQEVEGEIKPKVESHEEVLEIVKT